MKRTVAALSLILLTAASLEAAGPLTLREAVETGLEQNHGLRAASARAEASRADIGIARSRLLPKLSFEERFMRTNNPTYAFSSKLNQERFTAADFAIGSLNDPDEIDDFQTTLSFEMPLFVRQASVGLRMAREEYSAGRDELLRRREAAAFDIVKAYLTVNTASGFVEAAEAAVADAKEHLRIAEARHRADLGLLADVLRAKTGLLEAEQRLLSARKDARLAKRGLGLLIGLDEEAEAGPGGFGKPVGELQRYLSSAKERADLRSMTKRRENARNAVSLANSAYYPMVGVGGSYFLNDHSRPFGSEGQSWQVAAFLRWDIFDGALRGHEASKARLKSLEAAEELEGMKKAVAFSVHRAYLGVEEAAKTAELAEAALKSAEEGARLVRLRYENSLSPMVDLLDAQAALDNARAALVMKKNAFETSLAALAFESGTILEDLGVDGQEGTR